LRLEFLLLLDVEFFGKFAVPLLREFALALVFFEQELVLDPRFTLKSLLSTLHALLPLWVDIVFIVTNILVFPVD